MYILLIFLLTWFALGIFVFLFKVYVYCRGSKNYLDLVEFVFRTYKPPEGAKFAELRKKTKDIFIVGCISIHEACLGPFAIIQFMKFIVTVHTCYQKIQKNHSDM